MDFVQKAMIRIKHWITHNDHHQEEYEGFAVQLAEAGKMDSAKEIREVITLTARGTECLRHALDSLKQDKNHG